MTLIKDDFISSGIIKNPMRWEVLTAEEDISFNPPKRRSLLFVSVLLAAKTVK